MTSYQQQLLNSYPQGPTNTDGQAAFPNTYTHDSDSGHSWSSFRLKDPSTGAWTPLAAALALSVLFALLASPPVFQFMANTLGKLVSSIDWQTASGLPSMKLLLVHVLVFAVLSYVLLCMLTHSSSP